MKYYKSDIIKLYKLDSIEVHHTKYIHYTHSVNVFSKCIHADCSQCYHMCAGSIFLVQEMFNAFIYLFNTDLFISLIC